MREDLRESRGDWWTQEEKSKLKKNFKSFELDTNASQACQWYQLHLFFLTLSSNKGTKAFIVMWIPPAMKYYQKFSFRNSMISFKKYTFLGFTIGTSLRSLAPLSPSNLPDNIPSQLWKINCQAPGTGNGDGNKMVRQWIILYLKIVGSA